MCPEHIHVDSFLMFYLNIKNALRKVKSAFWWGSVRWCSHSSLIKKVSLIITLTAQWEHFCSSLKGGWQHKLQELTKRHYITCLYMDPSWHLLRTVWKPLGEPWFDSHRVAPSSLFCYTAQKPSVPCWTGGSNLLHFLLFLRRLYYFVCFWNAHQFLYPETRHDSPVTSIPGPIGALTDINK